MDDKKKNALYIGGALASVIGLAYLWASHSASSAAAAQQAVDQANSGGVDPATAAYEAALGMGSSGVGATSAPVTAGDTSGGSDLSTVLPGLLSALFPPASTTTAPPAGNGQPTDYSSQIAQLYQQYVGRTPEAAGTAYYNNLLNGGTSLQQVADYISNSPEAKSYSANQQVVAYQNIVQGDYSSLLGRAGSPSEISYYTNLLEQGTSPAQITAYFVGSPEYQAAHANSGTVAAAATTATTAAATPAINPVSSVGKTPGATVGASPTAAMRAA